MLSFENVFSLSLSLRASSKRLFSTRITVDGIKVRALMYIVIICNNTKHYLCGITIIIIIINIVLIASTLLLIIIIIIIMLLFTSGETHGAESGH